MFKNNTINQQIECNLHLIRILLLKKYLKGQNSGNIRNISVLKMFGLEEKFNKSLFSPSPLISPLLRGQKVI